MGTDNLDRLATNGIINYDADSYVKGTPARFVGNPSGYIGPPLDKPLMAEPPSYGITPGPLLSGAPSSKDAFINKNKTSHNKLPWKGILAGLTVAGLAIFTGVKVKEHMASFSNGKAFITNITTKLAKLPMWSKIAGGSLAGLLGLYGIYKMTSGTKHK